MSRLDVMMLALGWVLVIEGFTPMVAPGFWKESISRFLDEPDSALRITGLLLVALGLAIIWIV